MTRFAYTTPDDVDMVPSGRRQGGGGKKRSPRGKGGGGKDRGPDSDTSKKSEPEKRRTPDPRVTALKMLSAFLTAQPSPPTPRARMPMPASPRHPAGGSSFPRRGPAPPPVIASAPPQVPFPAALPAAPMGPAHPSAMEAIGRFLETARAGGMADWRRRRGMA